MRIIAIVNQKGGCGKTTTAVNLGAILARRGHRVLLVDLDPQSHCAAGLGVRERRIERHIGDAMMASPEDGFEYGRLLWRIARNLDLAPSLMRLAALESPGGGLAEAADREWRLSRVLDEINGAAAAAGRAYDVCLIDCPPSIGLLTYNALAAAKDVLIPVEMSYFALQGATKQINTVRSIARRLDVRVRSRLLPTMQDATSPLTGEVMGELERRFPSGLAPMSIRFDPALRRAAALGQPVIEYDPRTPGAADYIHLADWIVAHATLDRSDIPDAEMVAITETLALEDAMRRPDRPATLLADLPIDQPDDSDHDRPAGVVVSPDVGRFASRVAEPHATEPHVTGPGIAGPGGAGDVSLLYGARQTSQGVLFVHPIRGGEVVSIVGDFNGWNAGLDVMHRNEDLGIHELCLDIEPGERQYRLVVGEQWTTDPFNPRTIANSFGERNSVITVAPSTIGVR